MKVKKIYTSFYIVAGYLVELDIEYGDFLLKKLKLEIWRIENPKTLIFAILNFFTKWKKSC